MTEREKAMTPGDIPRLFVEFVKAGDFEGLATLYEEDAVIALPPEKVTRGATAIAEMFAARFAAPSQPSPIP